MSFYPEGTIIHEDNNIRYQIFSEEFFEQTLECIVDSRTAEGTIYADFSVDRKTLVKASEDFLREATIRIIAIDTSLAVPTVIGQILGEDFTVFVSGQHSTTDNRKINVLKQINRKLMQHLTNMEYQQNDIVIGSGYGVKKEYQNMKIGNTLSQLFLSVCLDSPYKVFCGLFYSRKASSIMCKNGGFLMCQLKVDNCKDIDSDISSYMKNDVEIVAYIDANKDSQDFQVLKNLIQDEKPLQIA